MLLNRDDIYELRSASCEITSLGVIEMYQLPLLSMERLFKEERLKHNNRLMIYAVNE